MKTSDKSYLEPETMVVKRLGEMPFKFRPIDWPEIGYAMMAGVAQVESAQIGDFFLWVRRRPGRVIVHGAFYPAAEESYGTTFGILCRFPFCYFESVRNAIFKVTAALDAPRELAYSAIASLPPISL